MAPGRRDRDEHARGRRASWTRSFLLVDDDGTYVMLPRQVDGDPGRFGSFDDDHLTIAVFSSRHAFPRCRITSRESTGMVLAFYVYTAGLWPLFSHLLREMDPGALLQLVEILVQYAVSMKINVTTV